MSYQILENYRDDQINKILNNESGNFGDKQKDYINKLSETEKRTIKSLLIEHIKLDKLDTSEPEIYIETEMQSAVSHLDNLTSHLKDDIFPLLSRTSGGAPFTVLRNILCYCDCIARLQYGQKGHSGDLEKLFENFGPYDYIQKRYHEYKKYLIQLYRHDLVHTVRPWSKIMFININNQVYLNYIGWQIIAELNDTTNIVGTDFFGLKSLLAHESNRKGLIHLRLDKNSRSPIINVYCFLFDLVNYIDKLKNSLHTNSHDMEKFLKNLIDIIIESNCRLLRPDVPTLDLDNNKITG